MLLKDSAGNPSLTHTMAIVSFVVVMVKVILSGASVSLAGGTYSLGTIDGFTIGAIFTPILGAYTARRWGSDDAPSVPVDGSGGRPNAGRE